MWTRWLMLGMLMGPVGVGVTTHATAAEGDLAAAKVLGAWELVLSPTEQERVDALEKAFQDPMPSDEDIASAGLSQEGTVLAGLIAGLRQTDPQDLALARYRAGLQGLKGASLTVDGTQMILDFGVSQSVLGYTVLDTRTSSMRIQTSDVSGEHSIAIIRFRDDDSVMMFIEEKEDGQRLVFKRP